MNFFDALDTQAGHTLVLVLLFFAGVAMVVFNVSKGEDVVIGSFSAILAIMTSRIKPQQ